MAGLKLAVVTGLVAVSNTPKTVYMATAGANAGLRLKQWSLAVDGTSPTEGKLTFEIVRKFTAGTGTSSTTNNPVRVHGHSGSPQATGKENYSAEPTSGGSTVVVYNTLIHPQGNAFVPCDILVDPGETIGFRITSPTAKGVRLSLEFEE